MRVVLGKFARSCIEAHLEPDPATTIQLALRAYAVRLESTMVPIAPPRFCRGQLPDRSAAAFELAVEPEVQAALEEEARRHAVRVEQLLAHAVFLYLAGVESLGLADGRILNGWALPN